MNFFTMLDMVEHDWWFHEDEAVDAYCKGSNKIDMEANLHREAENGCDYASSRRTASVDFTRSGTGSLKMKRKRPPVRMVIDNNENIFERGAVNERASLEFSATKQGKQSLARAVSSRLRLRMATVAKLKRLSINKSRHSHSHDASEGSDFDFL
jgi:hypothetical protein